MFLLEAKEHTLQSNAFIVLSKLLPHFPRVKRLELVLSKKIAAIEKHEDEVYNTPSSRQDIRALCKSYRAALRASEKHMALRFSCVLVRF